MNYGLRGTIAALALAGALADAAPAQSAGPLTPAEFKGTNYFPASSLGISNALSMLSASANTIAGAYSSSQVAAEIGQISKAGLNCVRVFPSFYGWLVCPANYMQNLRDLAQHCASRGVVITYVMWNTTSNVFTPTFFFVDPNIVPYDGGLHQTLQNVAMTYTLSGSGVPFQTVLSFNEPWQFVLHDSPGNALFEPPFDGVMASWPNNLKRKCEDYIDAIGNFFANDPVGRAAFGSYDLFNEPDCCNLLFGNQAELLSSTYKRLARIHALAGAPPADFTVGFADFNLSLVNHAALSSIRVKQTYLSYHCYDNQAVFDAVAAVHGFISSQLNIPVVCSEFYDKNRSGHLGGLAGMIGSLSTNGVGGNVWAYLATNLILRDRMGPSGTYIRFDGIVIPTAVPMTSYSSPLTFSMAPGAGLDALALRAW